MVGVKLLYGVRSTVSQIKMGGRGDVARSTPLFSCIYTDTLQLGVKAREGET